MRVIYCKEMSMNFVISTDTLNLLQVSVQTFLGCFFLLINTFEDGMQLRFRTVWALEGEVCGGVCNECFVW